MPTLNDARWLGSFTIDPAEPLARVIDAVQSLVAQARADIGPTAWPITIYQTTNNLSMGEHVTVVLAAGPDAVSEGEAERLIIDRLKMPTLLDTVSGRADRGSAWMQTATGRAFYPLDPRPEDLDLFEIASGLSRQCRYGGQIGRLEFYSVAEHCVLLSYAAPPELAAWALLHDASEAFICDVPRPIKPALAGYAEAEARLMQAVAVRYGLPWPMPDAIKDLDTRILQNERRALWAGDPPHAWVTDAAGPPLPGITISGWLPYQARGKFLARADELGIKGR